MGSADKLKRTAEWLGRLRRVVELFNLCIEVCDGEDGINEARLVMADFLDVMVMVLLDSFRHLRLGYTGKMPTEMRNTSSRVSTCP